MKLLIDCDYIVYKCCASAETEIDFGDDVIVPTLHEMLNQLGAAGWELVSHVVNQDNSSNGVTFHYYNFKRPINSVSYTHLTLPTSDLV